MKTIKQVILPVLFLLLLVSGLISFSNEMVTERQSYLSGKDENVSTRELAILASLVYEDVPNDESWGKNKGVASCNISKTHDVNYIYSVSGSDCFFSQKTKDGMLQTIKKGGYNVPYYIEGMSERKMNSVFATAVAELEPGQEYYFLNFADVKELEGKWSIVAYGHKVNSINKDENRPGWSNTFDAITFKKGDNYVITYRGTDFPDAAEWLLSDFGYAIKGVNTQTQQAYDYAQEQYKSIITNNPNAKVYVTGHSLGAYLAQVGGAAIVDYEAGRNSKSSVIDDSNWNSYETYKNETASHLEQVAYFNGMGVNGIFGSSDFAKNIQNALVYLSTHDKNGKRIENGRGVNYSNDIKSSGRLILYSMNDDPISNIGLHYGEILKLEYGADAKTRHSNHTVDIKAILNVGKDLTADDIKKITESYGTTKFTIDLFKSLYSYIKNTSSSNSSTVESGAIPKVVSEKIGDKYVNYGVSNIVNNILAIASDYGVKAELSTKTITKVLELFNVNHETDSFVCLLDKDNGYINDDNLKLEVISNNLGRSCTKDGCTFNNGYNLDILNEYKYGDGIKDYTEKESLLLKASVTNACAKSYDWYYKTPEDTEFNYIGNTENNQIYINNLISNTNDNSVYNYEFKVKVNYGDTYTPKTISLDNTGKIITYKTSDTKFKTNPTLDDGIDEEKTYGKNEKLSFEKSMSFNISYTDSTIDVYGYNNATTRSVELNTDGKINCIDNNCYTNQKYSSKDNYVTLKSKGNSHLWKYSLDGKEWKQLSDKTTDEIIVPEELLNIKENNKIRLYISDEQWKGEPLGECTATNNCILKNTILNYVYDTVEPKCSFDYNGDTIGISLDKKRLGGYKTATPTLKFVCTDNLSSFDKTSVTIDRFDVEDNGLFNNGLFAKKVSLEGNVTSDVSSFEINSRIPLKITGIPNNQTYVHYIGGIKDLAGNTSKVEKVDRSKIYLKIYEGGK